jgi:hypothetical protein
MVMSFFFFFVFSFAYINHIKKQGKMQNYTSGKSIIWLDLQWTFFWHVSVFEMVEVNRWSENKCSFIKAAELAKSELFTESQCHCKPGLGLNQILYCRARDLLLLRYFKKTVNWITFFGWCNNDKSCVYMTNWKLRLMCMLVFYNVLAYLLNITQQKVISLGYITSPCLENHPWHSQQIERADLFDVSVYQGSVWVLNLVSSTNYVNQKNFDWIYFHTWAVRCWCADWMLVTRSIKWTVAVRPVTQIRRWLLADHCYRLHKPKYCLPRLLHSIVLGYLNC